MKIESQVSSFELSRKLKELEVPQESYFWWVDQRNYIKDLDEKYPESVEERLGDELFVSSEDYRYRRQDLTSLYSAFSVAELGELIAKGQAHWTDTILETHFDNNDAVILTRNFKVVGPSEADARAKVLIYLMEEKSMN